MHLEKESAFVYRKNDMDKFLYWHSDKLQQNISSTLIKDYYLNENTRVRYNFENGNSCVCTIDTKTGIKNSQLGRKEFCSTISKEAADILSQLSKLVVEKNRITVYSDENWIITVDHINKPMNISIMEVEQLRDTPETPKQFACRFFEINLIECPLSAWPFFKRRIGICGTSSSGKTETAKMLTRTLKIDFGVNAENVTEYATTFIQKYNRNPSFHDQFLIWHGQSSREKDAASRADVVVSDSPSFLSYIYTLFLNKPEISPESSFVLSKTYKRAVFGLNDYSNIIMLKLNDYVENKVRYQTTEEAMKIQNMIADFLQHHNVKHLIAERDKVNNIIDEIYYINRMA